MTPLYFFIFGLFIGSFLNMLIDRLPREEQIVKGRSKCDSCKHELGTFDLLPVFSWVVLRGRCRYCKKKIPVRNTIVEILTAGLFVSTYLSVISGQWSQVTDSLTLFTLLTLISCLIVIFFIDLKHYIIPDALTLIFGISAVVLWFVGPNTLPYSSYLYSSLGAGGFFIFLVLITKGRGMGLGDVKFAFAMGLLLGYPGVVISLYIAFLTGAFVSVILILQRKKRFGQVVPFGPFLIFGTLIQLFNIIPDSFLRIVIPMLYM